MATSTTSSTAKATPTVDISNLAKGLFTDLGPLITLFGDEVTKQFLGMSSGWMISYLLTLPSVS